jgi:hypothetical protein
VQASCATVGQQEWECLSDQRGHAAVAVGRWLSAETTTEPDRSCRRIAAADARKSHLRKYSVRNAAFAVAVGICPLHLLRRSISLGRGDLSPYALLGRFLPRLRPLSGGLLFHSDSFSIARWRTRKDRRRDLFEFSLVTLYVCS